MTSRVRKPLARDPDSVEVLADFFSESEDHLIATEQILSSGFNPETNREQVQALFRAFHSLKSLASFVGLTDIVALGHDTETLLNEVREGRTNLAAHRDLFFDATAMMRSLIAEVQRALQSGDEPRGIDGFTELLERVERARCNHNPFAEHRPPGQITPIDIGASTTGIPQENKHVTQGVVVETPTVSIPQETDTTGASEEIAPRAGATTVRELVRVDAERLESLVDLVGELLIAESMLFEEPEIIESGSLQLRRSTTQIKRLTQQLQDTAMGMRLVEVRGVFSKLRRIVHDLSQRTGKPVTLTTEGDDTELDRTMIQQLHDPLVHILRNAVDHGIESEPDRRAAGKPTMATIHIIARHEADTVVIEITDDGRGLQRDKVLARARANGLISPSHSPSNAEIDALIFAPGLSTATVSDLSGRGVGMDVVKKNLEALRGHVEVSSTSGVGTSFLLTFPLTMLIVDGALIRTGSEKYVVPSGAILEAIPLSHSSVFTVRSTDEFVDFRGSLIPLIELARVLGVHNTSAPAEGKVALIVRAQTGTIALVVDEVLGQQQFVIKPLHRYLGGSTCFSGAVVLSTGCVALLIDVEHVRRGGTPKRYAPSPDLGLKQEGGA